MRILSFLQVCKGLKVFPRTEKATLHFLDMGCIYWSSIFTTLNYETWQGYGIENGFLIRVSHVEACNEVRATPMGVVKKGVSNAILQP